MSSRDPKTGDLLYPVAVHIHLTGQLMPLMIETRSWATAVRYLSSPEFRDIRDRVHRVTITNRAEPAYLAVQPALPLT
jgi:hypothetical protein